MVDGAVVATFKGYLAAVAALEAHVGGEDFTTRLSCDGSKEYGYASDAEADTDMSDCAYVPYIRECI